MNSIFEKHKWLKYVFGSFIVAIGILIIILAGVNVGKIQDVVNIVLAVALLVLGLFFLFTNLFNESHKGFAPTLLFSAVLLAAGITLLVLKFALNFGFDQKDTVYAISILTLVFGAVSLTKGISLIVYKEKISLILLMFLVATLGITLGILGIVFADKLVVATYIILGIIVVVFGILFIVFAAISDKKKA